MTDRLPPPDVPPIVHDGVIYQQDWDNRSALRGAYIVAIDQSTGRRIWSLRVIPYDVDPRQPQPPYPGTYLGSMRRRGGRLFITGEHRGRYVVDIASRTVISSDPSAPTGSDIPAKGPRGRSP